MISTSDASDASYAEHSCENHLADDLPLVITLSTGPGRHLYSPTGCVFERLSKPEAIPYLLARRLVLP